MALTEDDMAFLTSQELAQPNWAHGSGTATYRVVKDNEVSLHALQLNSSIGEFDAWENVSTIRIQGNKATSHSIQVNHPMSTSAFAVVMQAMRATRGGESAEVER